MPKRSVRLTPFARFLLVMVVVAPLAYMAAAYYNGENGWQKLKELVGIEKTVPAPHAEPTESPGSPTGASEANPGDYQALQGRLQDLEQKVAQLQQRLDSVEKRLEAKGE
ncbi:MAG: hypothetical protein KatS3mg029_0664 [Saprospiraceae bacterium]|nr:MAG: hypothetical protein KatS3mg029_0664 [Saprospiraceae bacterium]